MEDLKTTTKYLTANEVVTQKEGKNIGLKFPIWSQYQNAVALKYIEQFKNKNSKMAECLQYIFCCFSWSQTQTQRGNNNSMVASHKKKNKQKPKPKPSRIISKYRPQQTVQVEKQDKKKGKIVYTCPICTLYYNRILACNQCDNNICRFCAQSYEKKFQLLPRENMKCPFCSSQTSNFMDYEEAARSYFDTTGQNGFLDPAERKKIDEQMKMQPSIQLQNGQNNNRSMQLYRIEQEEANDNVIPTQNRISQVDHYIGVEIRRNPDSIEGQERQQDRDQSSFANLRDNHVENTNNQQRPQMSATV